MALQIILLETSFQEIVPESAAFAAMFYDKLLAEFPQTKALFASSNVQEQQKMLLGTLTLLIQNRRKPDVLADALYGLGQCYNTYGVRPEHYPIIGAVLLETFAVFLGERWTPELGGAWAEAYQAICTLILARTSTSLLSKSCCPLQESIA